MLEIDMISMQWLDFEKFSESFLIVQVQKHDIGPGASKESFIPFQYCQEQSDAGPEVRKNIACTQFACDANKLNSS